MPIILSTLIFALFNRIRGGLISFDKIMDDFLGFHIPFFFRGKAVFMYGVMTATWIMTQDMFLSSVVGFGMFLWAIDGWGGYFLTGTDENSFGHYEEVLWIDWVLAWLFIDRPLRPYSTAEWVLFPFPCKLPRVHQGCVCYPLEKEKRAIYETIGMTLRGTHVSYLAIFLCFFFGSLFPLWLIPLGMMLGPIYYYARRCGYDGDTTALAEILTGFWYGLCINIMLGVML